MEKPLFYIASGKMFCLNEGREREIPSGVLHNYIERVKNQAKRNEWKQSGSGGAFLGETRFESAETQLSNIRSAVTCIGFQNGRFIYSMSIDSAAGIYSKRSFSDTDEGIVLSDSDYRYTDFDVAQSGDLIASAYFAGEAHLALLRAGERSASIITEGECVESSPVWSKTKPDTVYFSSAGLLEMSEDASTDAPQSVSLAELMSGMMQGGSMSYERERSAQSLCELDIAAGQLRELLSDPKYSFVRPQCDGQGRLYYIKKPFSQDDNDRKKGGCLMDILMAPVRLFRAIVGFFNVFTIKYSGKNLTTSTGSAKAKNKDADKIFIDGNLIAAEKERQANKDSGESYPGIIPRSFELRCMLPDGSDRLIKKGVLAYRLDGEDIIYSNGSYIIRLCADGTEQKLTAAEKATFILV